MEILFIFLQEYLPTADWLEEGESRDWLVDKIQDFLIK